MKNYVQPGNTITITAAGNITSGQLVVSGFLVGVANADAATGEQVELDINGVFELPKVSGDSFAVGNRLYWNGSALTNAAGTGSRAMVGIATEAAGAGVLVARCAVIPTLQQGPA